MKDTKKVEEVEVIHTPKADSNQKPSLLKKLSTWAVIGLVLLTIGAAITYIALYIPAHNNFILTRTELTAMTTKADGLQTDLDKTKADLSSMQTENARLNQSLKETGTMALLARLQYDVAAARLGLASKDSLAARQSLALAEQDLTDLIPLLPDTETAQGLKDRLSTASVALGTSQTKAAEELRSLAEALTTLQERMK